MIGHFPQLYPDELLLSVYARHYDRVNYPSRVSIMRELFGHDHPNRSYEFPGALGLLLERLPPGHGLTIDRLIDEHTPAPLYGPFLPPDRYKRLRESMINDEWGAAVRHAGSTIICTFQPKRLRFCPLCAKDDKERVGEPYWHRLHQVQGVVVCPVHDVFLETSNASRLNYQFTSAHRAIPAVDARPVDAKNTSHISLLQIARDARWLLGRRGPCPALDEMSDLYAASLQERGLVNVRGVIKKWGKLREEFERFYPSDFWEHLGASPGDRDETRRVFNVLSSRWRGRPRARSPIYHLIMIHFLGYTAEAFFGLRRRPGPFGAGPWPCLNPVGGHFRELRISECRVRILKGSGGPPVGLFSCECGFAYNRTGPDRSPDDLHRIGKVRSYGNVWEEALTRLWLDPKVTTGAISERLCVNVATVKKQASRLGLPFPRVRGVATASVPEWAWNPAEHYRGILISALAANPKATRTWLKKKIKNALVWLRRNDAEWLKRHLPPYQKKSSRTRKLVYREERDRKLAAAVEATASRIKNAPGPPVRISRLLIVRELSSSMPNSPYRLHNYPLADRALRSVAETGEEFALRRIRWVASLYRREGVLPSRAKMLRRSSLSNQDLITSPVLAEAITAALTSIELSVKSGRSQTAVLKPTYKAA